MNTKTKIMLGLSVLTAGTLAAGATGTFAWFTTNKTAKATYTNIVAAATQGNIKASITGITEDGADAAQGTDVTATGTKSYISDVSSNDGINFVQPDWIGESGNSKTASRLINVSKTAGYFTQYNITLTNVSGDTGTTTGDGKVNVKLSKITIASADFAEMTNWVRVAIMTDSFTSIGEVNGTGTTAGVYTDVVTTGTNDKYVKELDSTAKTLTLDTSVVKSSSDLSANPLTVATELALNSSKTIGISVWLEGTANGDTAQDGCKGKSVSVALEFTASAANA